MKWDDLCMMYDTWRFANEDWVFHMCQVILGLRFHDDWCKYDILFSKYRNKYHILMGNKLYVNKEDDMLQEDLYLKKQLVGFVKELCYIKGVTPQDEDLWKLLKRLY